MYSLEDKKIYKIAFCGSMGSGKTQAAVMLAGMFQNRFGEGRSVSYVIKFANPLYTASKAFHQMGKPRYFLQRLGDLARSEFGDNIFEKIFEENVVGLNQEIIKKPEDHILIMTDDLRFKGEYELVKRLDFKVVKIEANENIRKERIGESFTNVKHRSELELNLFEPDFILDNNYQDPSFETYYNRLLSFIIDSKIFED